MKCGNQSVEAPGLAIGGGAVGTEFEREDRLWGRGVCGVVWGEGVPFSTGEGPSPKKNSMLALKYANFGANWVLFVQFT